MTENTMPAAEAMVGAGDEHVHYEFAFHVLPTVAEGEVATVVAALKAEIAKAGGTITDEEEAERVELAYEVEKHLEGRNRKFRSAYFGWIRFTASTEGIPTLLEEVAAMPEILRHLLVKLTREEVANPFRFHEAMAAANIKVTDIDVTAEAEAEVVADEEAPVEAATEESVDSKPEVA